MKKTIRKSVQEKKKARAAGACEAGRQANLEDASTRAATMTEAEQERADRIKGMTNWQKSQMSRAQKKGVEMPIEQVRMFATAQRRA